MKTRFATRPGPEMIAEKHNADRKSHRVPLQKVTTILKVL